MMAAALTVVHHSQRYFRCLSSVCLPRESITHLKQTDKSRQNTLSVIESSHSVPNACLRQFNHSQAPNMAKFCANLAFMFTDLPFVERYAAAKHAGFKAVESGFPFNVSLEDATRVKSEAGVQQILVNVFTGDVTKGELGFAAIPGEEENFKNSITTTIEYAKALNASKIHVMSGKVANPTEENDKTYEANLRYAVKLFEKENILGVIEPINKYSVPGYYMNSYDKALKVLKSINSPNLKLLLDVFHLQHIQGNITNTILELKEWIGHVQIAQVPDRNEPDTPGEVNYEHVLKSLKSAGYDDWVGLEYKPQGDPVAGLKWITSFGYNL